MELLSQRELRETTARTSVYDIPMEVEKIELSIDRTFLNDSNIALFVQLFITLDGKAWHPCGAFGAVGGEIQNKETGLAEAKSGMLINIPSPELAGRKLLATLTVVGGSVETKLNCEMI